MTDQHRGDALGRMGNKAVRSPHLDQLAQEGVLFINGYSSTSSSTPARAGLLTGMSPWHHGMLGYGQVAETYRYEMPRMLRDFLPTFINVAGGVVPPDMNGRSLLSLLQSPKSEWRRFGTFYLLVLIIIGVP